MLKILEAVVLTCLLILVVFGCNPMQVKNESEVTLAPSKVHEDCMELIPTDVLYYSFKTEGPVNFNIHYHEGAKITYPVTKDNTAGEEGRFYPDRKQYFCLMWTNPQSGSVRLTYTFRIEKQ